ncbi:MAG: rhombosortase [Gammaproteobacteria bacterium]
MTLSHRHQARGLQVPAGLAAAMLLAALLPGSFELLAWTRGSADGGQWWRLASCQFVHLGPGHLGLNLAGLAAAGVLLRSDFRRRDWLAVTAASMAGVAAGLVIFLPEIGWYAGFSGALHGIFAGAAATWVRRGRREGWLLAGVLAAKLAWETWAGPSGLSVVLTGGPILAAAHLWGALAGGLWGLLRRLPGDVYNPRPGSGESG